MCAVRNKLGDDAIVSLWSPAIAGISTLALLYWRAHDSLTVPQLRYEDGTIFFLQERLDGVSSFLIPYAGYLHFMPRLVAFLASPFGAVAAPKLYMAASVVITIWAAITVATARTNFAWLLGAVILAVPHTGEIFALVTDVQWIMAPALALTLITPSPASAAIRVNQGVFVAAASLSGPFCLFAIPLALWRIARDRTRFACLLVVEVIMASVIQAMVVLKMMPSASGEAQTTIRLALLLIDRWFGQLSHSAAETQTGWQMASLAVVAIGSIIALWPRDRRTMFCLLYLFSILILAGTCAKFNHSSEWEWFANAQFSDRYFYVPRLVVVWSLLLLVADMRAWSLVGLASVIVLAINDTSLWFMPTEPRLPWDDEARRIDRGEAVQIAINPVGPKPWVVELPARYRPDKSLPSNVIRSPTCQGSIDILRAFRAPGLYDQYKNGDDWLPLTGVLFIDRGPMFRTKVYVRAEGWLLDTGVQDRVPDEVFVVLTAPDGTRSFQKAQRVPRKDILTPSNQPNLPDVGYRLWLDMSQARGVYTVSLAGGYQGSLTMCSQFKGLVEVN